MGSRSTHIYLFFESTHQMIARFLLITLTLNGLSGQFSSAYRIPQPTATALSPRGFRISIPDQRGISLFAFHGNINKVFKSSEVGEYHGETRTKINNQWVYESDRYQLQPGDVLHFWIYVQHDNFGYQLGNQRYVYPDHFQTQSGSNQDSTFVVVDETNYSNGDNLPWNSNYPTERTTTTTTRSTSWSNQTPYYPPISGNENTITNRPPPTRTTTTTTRSPTRGPTHRPNTNRPTPTPTPTQNYWPSSMENQCARSITTANGRSVTCKGTLIFEEQFNGDILGKWTQDVRMPLESEDAEFVVYHKYPSVWNVSYGNLHIFPKLIYKISDSGFSEYDIRSGRFAIDPRECTSTLDAKQECERQAGLKKILPPVVSTKFRSKKSFSFKYGQVEIRAKLPKGDWMFPQLYLEPSQNVYRGVGDSAYLNGQVRIAFIRGNEYLEKSDGIPIDGKTLTGAAIVAPGDHFRETARKSTHFGEEHFGNDFHIYSIIWTNTSIRFSVDGLEYGTDTGGYKQLKNIPNAIYWENGSMMAPFDQEFYLSLGVGVGGNADFPDSSRTGWSKIPKPWENTSPKAELSFYLKVDDWISTWNSRESGLIVDYVKVYSV